MVRVLLINAGYVSMGGVQKHCGDLLKLFDKDDSVSVFSLPDIPLKTIPFINKNFYNWKDVYKLVRDTNYDMIHIHGYLHICAFQLLLIAVLLKKKILLSPHFHPFKYITRPLLGRAYFTCFLTPLLRFVSLFFTLNNDDSMFFKKYPNVMIPHWINCEIIPSSVQRKRNFILFVGRNEKNKGLEHLYNLPKNKYEIHCVTKGPLKRADFILHENASDDELNRLYYEASVLVVPSRYEAFSLVSLEALVRGCPIVLSDRVRIADHLAGVSGVEVFQFGDYSAFEKSISMALGEVVCTRLIYDRFSAARVKQLYKTAYLQVYSNR